MGRGLKESNRLHWRSKENLYQHILIKIHQRIQRDPILWNKELSKWLTSSDHHHYPVIYSQPISILGWMSLDTHH